MCTIGTAATSIQLLRWMDNNNNKLYQHCVSPFSFSACVVENFAETKDIGNRSVRSIIFHLPCGKCKHTAHWRIDFANMTSSRTSLVTKKFGGRESDTQRQTLNKMKETS